MSSGRLQELKNNRKSLNFQAQKVVAVAYRRWSFTRGSNCKALTVFRIGGRLWEVVAYEKWSHMEVRVYMTLGCFMHTIQNKTYEQSLHLRMARGEGSHAGINRKTKE